MVANDWPLVLLGDVAAEVTVGYVGPMAHEYLPAGVPFLRSQNILPYRLELTDVIRIPPEFHRKLSKSALHPGDVVVVRTGKPGTAAVIPEDLGEANCADFVIIRTGPRLNPRFLAYKLNSKAGQEFVDSRLVGSVQKHFNVGHARGLRFPLPPLGEQKRIAAALGALDNKIDLNRGMNRTLEEMARALFKSWFVDFDPVRAKAAGKKPWGMDAKTAALFPDAFEESEIG